LLLCIVHEVDEKKVNEPVYLQFITLQHFRNSH